MTVPIKGKKIGLVFCRSTGDIEVKGLGSEQHLTGIGQNPPWVPTVVLIYDGAEQKDIAQVTSACRETFYGSSPKSRYQILPNRHK